METPFKLEETPYGSFKIKDSSSNKLCSEFHFIKDEDEDEDEHDDGTVLYISTIFKCGEGMPLTRKVIKFIEEMVKSNPAPPWSRAKYIKLVDGSSIHVCTVDIDLRYLKILTTGESWYNSFGYKSVDHDANVAHNAVIINKPMNQLLSDLYDPVYIKKFKARFPELSTDLTVKEYVTAMSNGIPRSGTRSCTKEQEKRARLLYNLVHHISKEYHGDVLNPNHLEYNINLQKPVERGRNAGGGTKRTVRKSRRKTRTRKCIKRKTV